MDKNIEQVKDFRKNRGEKSYIIYINTIGSYSDEHMNKLFKCFEKINRTKRGNYGTFKARKYSFKDILEKNCVEVCKEVIERLSSIYNYFVDYDYIIATGGTFEAWKDVFINAFKDVEDLRVIPANINNVSVSTVYSNVNGYYYYLSNMLGRSKTA